MKQQTIKYKDHLIIISSGFYFALGKVFRSIVLAKKEIDKYEA